MNPAKSGSLPEGYEKFVEELKGRIRSAQVRAALSVNRELVLLYWNLGREILNRQSQEGWGAKIIDRLSVDLTHAFPGTRGFGARNLKYMRAFAELPRRGICATGGCTIALGPPGPHSRCSEGSEPERMVHPAVV